MNKIIKIKFREFDKLFKSYQIIFLVVTMLIFGQNIHTFANYGTTGGGGTTQKLLQILDGLRNIDGLKLEDPYDCGGQIIYGFVQGGTKPYTVSLSIVNRDRTINRGANFANDGSNWTVPVSYDSNSSNYIPTGEYVINSSVRDANGSTDSYTYSAFIRPPQDCNTSSNNNTSPSVNSNIYSSSSSNASIVTLNQSGNNNNNDTGAPLSQTNQVVKIVQTQLLRTGGFGQSNPLLFSSSILFIALGISLLIRKPKGIIKR